MGCNFCLIFAAILWIASLVLFVFKLWVDVKRNRLMGQLSKELEKLLSKIEKQKS